MSRKQGVCRDYESKLVGLEDAGGEMGDGPSFKGHLSRQV